VLRRQWARPGPSAGDRLPNLLQPGPNGITSGGRPAISRVASRPMRRGLRIAGRYPATPGRSACDPRSRSRFLAIAHTLGRHMVPIFQSIMRRLKRGARPPSARSRSRRRTTGGWRRRFEAAALAMGHGEWRGGRWASWKGHGRLARSNLPERRVRAAGLLAGRAVLARY
jgi:hypothetical protein